MTVKYCPEKHLILKDFAHLRRMTALEWEQLLVRVPKEAYDPKEADRRLKLFKVQLPHFPPVRRRSLAMVFGRDNPWREHPWRGVVWACNRSWWANRECTRIAVDIVPDIDQPHRIAYQWRVPQFDPKLHIPARAWCKLNNVHMMDYCRVVVEGDLRKLIVDTVNPFYIEERKVGSYSPTRRCIPRKRLHLFEQAFGLEGSQLPEIPKWPNHDYGKLQKTITIPKAPKATEIEEMIESSKIRALLKKRLNSSPGRFWRRRVYYFGDQLSDKAMYYPKREEVEKLLAADPTDKRSYVRDSGGKNYDCDDFALCLKAAASLKGINSCGIIWGDHHAWNFFVIKGDNGPEFLFVEPQTDAEIEEMSGDYSIRKRCSVYL